MAEVFAGFVCGFALALIVTPFFALWLLQSRNAVPFIKNAVPEGMSIVMLSVPVSSFFFLIWTMIGIVLGMVLVAAQNATTRGGFGTYNILYTVIVVLLAFIIFFPPFVLVRSARRLTAGVALSFLLLFGWATPFLAHLASIRWAQG
ncbi:MAG: hypothetical protein ABR978_08225 [Dehalococcoidia bacterium]